MNSTPLDQKTKDRIAILIQRYVTKNMLYPEWVRIGLKLAKENGIPTYPINTGLEYANLRVFVESGQNHSVEVGASVTDE